jgi:hypothetical protein
VSRTAAAGRLHEAWRHPAGATVSLRVDGARVSLDDRPGAPLRRRWDRLGPVLSRCLGDPFARPLAGDPRGERTLQREGGAWLWVLRFSGGGTCALDGTLTLQAGADRVDARGLWAAGRPWAAGGREAALARMDGATGTTAP